MEEGKELREYKKLDEITVLPATQAFMTVSDQMVNMIPTAGTVNLTQEQKDILYAPVKEEDVEIRPDGLVYLPWMEYVSRLRDAFGMNWAIIPQALPKAQGNHIMWPFYLVIQGKLAGFAFGEQEYQPTNYTMTWGDACEGAKSNALMRLCKGIGISLELWKPSFIKVWKDKHAESYNDPIKKDKYGKPKKLWKKKGTVTILTDTEIPQQEEKKTTASSTIQEEKKEDKSFGETTDEITPVTAAQVAQMQKLARAKGITTQADWKRFWEYAMVRNDVILAAKVIDNFEEYYETYNRMIDAQSEGGSL